MFQALDGINENISDLQSDIDADSGTDDDEYDDPEPNQVNPNPSNDDEQESEPEIIPVWPRKNLQWNRLVHSIDSAFDEMNFTQIELLAENKTYEVEIEAKKKDQAARIVTWKSKKPTPPGRLGRHNIISEKPGPTKYSKDAKTVLDSWKLFLSDDIILEIVLRTNEKIESFRQTVDPKIFEGDKCLYVKETNAAEIYAFIGLVYARGLQGQNAVRTELLFSESYGHSFFSATISKNRFKYLFSKISFDDFETRTERWEKDRSAAIRNIFEKFNNNYSKSIILDDLLSIDETLCPMTNKLAFKQFNPNKPAKYGLLFKSINASRYPYSFVSAPYCRKPFGEPTEEYKPGTFEVTKHMVSKLQLFTTLKGRNISFDRLHTALPLMNYLLEKDMTAVRTLVSNGKGVLKKFVKTAGRKEFSHEILWNADDVRMTLTAT